MGALGADSRQARFKMMGLAGIGVVLGASIGLASAYTRGRVQGFLLLGAGGGLLLLITLRVALKQPWFVLAVYGADLPKVLVSVLPLLAGKPRAWDAYVSYVDYGVAAIAAGTLLLVALLGKARWRRWFVSVPVVSQLALTCLRLVGVLKTPDSYSLAMFAQFVGGNILLLLMPVAVCRSDTHVRRVWRIWLIMALVLALAAVWMLSQGAVSRGARARYLALGGIRTGRVCAVATIYLLVATSGQRLSSQKRCLRLMALMILLSAILTTGSKAALVGLIAVLALYVGFFLRRRAGCIEFLGLSVVGLSVLLFFVLNPMNLSFDVLRLARYARSLESRALLAQHYLQLGWSSPLVGSGIRSSYGGDSSIGRTHNVLLELYVQGGILGPVLFLLFFVSTLAYGWRAIRMTSSNKRVQNLIIATLLACLFTAFMAQITGDIGGNRDLWLFSGLLLALVFQHGKSNPM